MPGLMPPLRAVGIGHVYEKHALEIDGGVGEQDVALHLAHGVVQLRVRGRELLHSLLQLRKLSALAR